MKVRIKNRREDGESSSNREPMVPSRRIVPIAESYGRGRFKAPQLRIRDGKLTAQLNMIVALPPIVRVPLIVMIEDWLRDPSLSREERSVLERSLNKVRNFR
jgi:hypothetical protein